MKYLLFLILLPVAAIGAEKVDSIDASIDSYIATANPNTNYGSGDTMRIFTNTNFGDSRQRALLKFDISGIPDTAYGLACTVWVWMKDAPSGAFDMVSGRCLQAWVESEVTWDSAATDPGGIDWNTDGAMAENATDCDNAAGGSYDVEGPYDSANTGTTDSEWLGVPVDTCHIKDWITGDDSNNGLLLFKNTSSFYGCVIHSSEGDSIPFLEVYYDTTAVVATGAPDYLRGPDGTGVKRGPGNPSYRRGP